MKLEQMFRRTSLRASQRSQIAWYQVLLETTKLKLYSHTDNVCVAESVLKKMLEASFVSKTL